MFSPPGKKIIVTLTIILAFGYYSFLFAQEPKTNQEQVVNRGVNAPSLPSRKKENNLTEFQKQARIYREQGLELQRTGDIEGAMALYQKAVEMDPGYAVVYNDLGIIYEAEGWPQRAEESYLKAINIDLNFLSAYSNLALCYENQRDLKQAAFYWKKRSELSPQDDPWAKKARQRLDDISLVLGEKGDKAKERELEIIEFMDEVAARRALTQEDDKALADDYFTRAKISYGRKDYLTALKQALDAQQLDPSDKNIGKFIDKLQRRLLSR